MRPPRGGSIGKRHTQRLAGERVCAGASKARVAHVGVPPGFAIPCLWLSIAATLQVLRDTAPERHVGRHLARWCRKIDPGATEATRAGSLLGRCPGTHVVPRGARIVTQPSFHATELHTVIML